MFFDKPAELHLGTTYTRRATRTGIWFREHAALDTGCGWGCHLRIVVVTLHIVIVVGVGVAPLEMLRRPLILVVVVPLVVVVVTSLVPVLLV